MDYRSITIIIKYSFSLILFCDIAYTTKLHKNRFESLYPIFINGNRISRINETEFSRKYFIENVLFGTIQYLYFFPSEEETQETKQKL